VSLGVAVAEVLAVGVVRENCVCVLLQYQASSKASASGAAASGSPTASAGRRAPAGTSRRSPRAGARAAAWRARCRPSAIAIVLARPSKSLFAPATSVYSVCQGPTISSALGAVTSPQMWPSSSTMPWKRPPSISSPKAGMASDVRAFMVVLVGWVEGQTLAVASEKAALSSVSIFLSSPVAS
jgi:hypothetical protein